LCKRLWRCGKRNRQRKQCRTKTGCSKWRNHSKTNEKRHGNYFFVVVNHFCWCYICFVWSAKLCCSVGLPVSGTCQRGCRDKIYGWYIRLWLQRNGRCVCLYLFWIRHYHGHVLCVWTRFRSVYYFSCHR